MRLKESENLTTEIKRPKFYLPKLFASNVNKEYINKKKLVSCFLRDETECHFRCTKKKNTSARGFSRKQHSGKKISFPKMFFYQNRRLKNPNRLNYISFHKYPFKKALKRSSEKTENYILSLWHISCNPILQYTIVKQCSI